MVRKTTQEMADKLACFGWVQNTIRGTVVGEHVVVKSMVQNLKNIYMRSELARVDKVDISISKYKNKTAF